MPSLSSAKLVSPSLIPLTRFTQSVYHSVLISLSFECWYVPYTQRQTLTLSSHSSHAKKKIVARVIMMKSKTNSICIKSMTQTWTGCRLMTNFEKNIQNWWQHRHIYTRAHITYTDTNTSFSKTRLDTAITWLMTMNITRKQAWITLLILHTNEKKHDHYDETRHQKPYTTMLFAMVWTKKSWNALQKTRILCKNTHTDRQSLTGYFKAR